MSEDELIERCLKLPALLKQGQVLIIARKLGLGQARVRTWLAHETERRQIGAQWRYPRDVTLQGLLDMAGIQLTVGPCAVAAVRVTVKEGAPGSNP